MGVLDKRRRVGLDDVPDRADRLVGFAPEDRLLMECSRVEIGPDGAERISALLARPLDWDAILEASIRHGVTPLVWHGLRSAGAAESVPAQTAELLQLLHQQSGQRNRRLFATLGGIVAALRAVGVDPVGLKDIGLAVDVYPEPGLRPMGDLDLLIRREDWTAAAGCLERLGFLARPSSDVPYTHQYAPAQHFRRARDEIWIDLQWNVMEREWDSYGEGRFTYDGLGMWQRAQEIPLDGFALRVPTLEDMLFHLCLHLEGHRYSELVLFCDIAELLRRRGSELRWDELLRITRRYRAEASVYYVLLLTERLLSAPLPSEVLDELKPPYFDGSLHAPLFGNLGQLHLSLDQIRLSVAPPPQLMDGLERATRLQTAQALRLQTELHRIASAFREGGGTLILFDGRPSVRMFPDPAVPAFEPVDIYVLAHDEQLLREALGTARTLEIETRDPTLVDERPSLRLVPEWPADPLATPDEEEMTNARSALRSVRYSLAPAHEDPASARLIARALGPEELVLAIAAKVGAARDDRLFVLCPLLEVMRGLSDGFDADRVLELASRRGVLAEVCAGLAIAAGLAGPPDGQSLPGAAADIPPQRVLEWARYGPTSMRRYPWLRTAYYFAFVVTATPGLGPKCRYVGRSLRRNGRDEEPAVLPALLREVATGLRGARAAASIGIQDLAHWIEPSTAALLDGRLPAAG
jgi:hypothetical protein